MQRTAPAKVEKAEPSERTDDPVRLYLREMGSVELLSREGEIAVAKCRCRLNFPHLCRSKIPQLAGSDDQQAG